MIDRDAEGATNTVGAARQIGGSSEVVPLDLSNTAAIPGAVDRVLGLFGRIDILVNCAAVVGEHGTVLDLSEEAWDAVHAVNLKAPLIPDAAGGPSHG